MKDAQHTNEEYDYLFAELKSKVKAAGLYAKCQRRAFGEFFIVISLVLVSLYSISNFHPFITVLLFALTIMRATFVAHDLIHRQYFASRETNKRFSYIFANMIMGISRSWWENKHNFLHHTFTNIIDKDMDIDACGGAFIKRYNYPRLFHKFQHILFWPLLTLLYFVFWIQSVVFTVQKKYWGELSLLLVNISVPVYIIYTLGWTGFFIVLSMYLVWGAWFGAVIITNHLGLEMFPEESYKDFTWLELQNRTSRNINGGLFIHWFYGGLNTQVEHHLYPKAPRFYLLKAAKITQEFCLKNNIIYITSTPWQAYKDIYTFLKNTRPKV